MNRPPFLAYILLFLLPPAAGLPIVFKSEYPGASLAPRLTVASNFRFPAPHLS